MEPGFQRGDILFLENNTEELVIGDVVVFKIKGRDIPIVHRVLSKYKRCGHVNPSLCGGGRGVLVACTYSVVGGVCVAGACCCAVGMCCGCVL